MEVEPGLLATTFSTMQEESTAAKRLDRGLDRTSPRVTCALPLANIVAIINSAFVFHPVILNMKEGRLASFYCLKFLLPAVEVLFRFPTLLFHKVEVRRSIEKIREEMRTDVSEPHP